MDQPIQTRTQGPTRYDGLLAALPAAIAGGTAAGWWLSVPTLMGIAAGGLVATLLVSISLFVVPPT